MSRQEFEELITRHAQVMSAAIRRVCARRNRELIPDVEQEVRLALWKRLQGGKKIEHPVSYVYKVALTTALAVMRRDAPREVSVEEGRLDRESGGEPAPAGWTGAERAHLLDQVLGRIPQDQERALRAWLAGFNHREVARLFGWTESVARHRIYRGMDALRGVARQEAGDD